MKPATPLSPSRLRSPLLLLLVLLLAILTVLGFTIYSLRGERALLEQTLKTNQQQSLALLASRTEEALGSAIQAPFLVLKNVPLEDVDDERLMLMRQHFLSVEQVLLLNQNFAAKHSFPVPLSARRARFDDWLAQRVQEEYTPRQGHAAGLHRFAPRTFVEPVGGQFGLFAFQPIADLDPTHEDGYIVLRFNVPVLTARYVAPLLAGFTQEQGGQVRLEPAGSRPLAHALYFPLSRYLPGWQLVYTPDPERISRQLQHQNWTIWGVSAGVLLVILMAVLAAWWELRQEHALIDLRKQFVANVSHELKTPLALIRMFAETLYLRRVTDPSRVHEYHLTILREAERLTRMINNVLDFSRLDMGAKVYELTDMDLRRTISDILERYAPHLAEKRLSLRTFLDENLPPVAHDRNGITQILLNLLDNAAKYAASGEAVEVHLHGNPDWVELQVIDFGPGIPANEAQRIRKAYYRGQALPSASGSGLGLALVEKIAAAHQAHFVLDQPAGGSGVKAVVSFPTYKGKA
ncbi:HAMP domain-containing sensor histidine kinase [Thermithiobacillus tepidarius DSM 3134]|uniref:sensor histidine kinase n=1 Tax=Thermithiobacillus tepidarius TaxID=929 RepID=UPI0004268ED8|nr:HAMP domain-containing sensor histidine kinase [Thermithiobacillus tepidarius]